MEGIKYPVKVFEEAFGETIFSSGADQARVGELWFPGDNSCHDCRDGGCESSVDPHSLSTKQRSVSPKCTKATRRIRIQNSQSLMMTIDSCRSKSNGMISGKSGMAGTSFGHHMSLMEKNLAESLMVKGTLGIRRRETKGKSDFPLLKHSSAMMQEGRPDKMEVGSPGSTNRGLLPYLDWNKPMGFINGEFIPSSNNAFAKSSVGLQPNRSGAKRSKLKSVEEPEIFVGSLYNSNIVNMNRIFLNKFNQIMAEEIWEIEKWLGVQSAEDDQTVIHRITDLED
ncbi:hypothetical protein Ancab_032259 [Ancistrocladus abbreviatus]